MGQVLAMRRKRNATATRWENAEELRDAGDFMFTGIYGRDGVHGMMLICPCGCGEEIAIDFTTDPTPGPKWEWNGNVDKPTLTPRLFKLTGCQWHGTLKDGIFQED